MIEALRDFPSCLMSERTPFHARVRALPNLKLVITTGMRNASIEIVVAQELA